MDNCAKQNPTLQRGDGERGWKDEINDPSQQLFMVVVSFKVADSYCANPKTVNTLI